MRGRDAFRPRVALVGWWRAESLVGIPGVSTSRLSEIEDFGRAPKNQSG